MHLFAADSPFKITFSAALPGQVGAASHLVDSAVRFLNGRALQLAAQAGLDVGQILLPQCLLLGFSASVRPTVLLFLASALMRAIFSSVIRGTSCISS